MNKVQEFFDSRASNWDSYCAKNESQLCDILKDIVIYKGDKVLDLACGTGVITNILFDKTQTDLYAIDISSKMIKIAKEKINNPQIHFTAVDFLKYEEKDFDAIVIFDAYPHFLDFEAFKKQVLKSLKSGGFLYIIHDCGREELNHHHITFAKEVSRGLKPVKEEAEQFKDSFDILDTFENNCTYHIYLKKK